MHGCSPVNLLHIFRTPFPTNTSWWLLLVNVTHDFFGEKFLNLSTTENRLKSFVKHFLWAILTSISRYEKLPQILFIKNYTYYRVMVKQINSLVSIRQKIWLLIHSWQMYPFNTSWKHQEFKRFLVFSGGIKWEHWPEIVYLVKHILHLCTVSKTLLISNSGADFYFFEIESKRPLKNLREKKPIKNYILSKF